MCGRFGKFSGCTLIREELRVVGEPSAPRWNVAPGGESDVIREEDGERRIAMARWGLVPAWAKDEAIGFKTFNARSESLAEKPTFHDAFRKRRCIIPMDGFYEWERTGSGKQPWFIRLRDDQPMAVAGLWERRERDDATLDTFTVITCPANDLLQPIHDRMPVILPLIHWAAWLDPALHDPGALQPMLLPADPGAMERFTVSPRVNATTDDDPGLVEPWVPESPPQTSLF
jgi:putative SOS response-associated peptidase YedK